MAWKEENSAMFMFDEGIFTPSMHMLLIHNVLDNLFNVVCSTNFLRVSQVTRKLEKFIRTSS